MSSAPASIDSLIEKLAKLPPKDQAELRKQADRATKHLKWVPNPGPQTEAYTSQADVLLYGGEPGGGKSQLGLGLAFNEHERTLCMRREYGDLDRLIEDALKIHGSKDGFNGKPPPKLTVSRKQIIDFAAAHRVGDEQGQMGKGHDLIFIDEATHFAESQVRFLMGWNRTENMKQRCRVVLATNPPLTAEGLWVNKMFAPWLDPKYPNPAKPGELRWVVTDADGNDKWVEGPGKYEVMVAGIPKLVEARSRTYIPASVRDNPYYVATGYEAQLDSLPEPLRSILLGGFKTEFQDAPNQVIPTAWVKAAQTRWKENPRPPDGVPMCAIGFDASGGGKDPAVIARRFDGWYAPMIRIPGKEIPQGRAGSFCAGQIVSYRKDNCLVIIDMGGGYGASTFEKLTENEMEVRPYKGAEGTARRSKDGKLKFVNVRSAALWYFREALNPDQTGGSPIMLPDDPLITADLTAPTFDIMPHGVRVEAKEDVCDRLGRSTDDGDAVVMAWWEGPKEITHALDWVDRKQSKKGQQPKVIMGRRR